MTRKALLILAVSVLAAWLVPAAINWQIDPGQWSGESRSFAVLLLAPFVAFLLGMALFGPWGDA